MQNKQIRKISRKTKHCEGILQKHENIGVSKIPTHSLLIGNGGLGCGLTREFLMEVFAVYGQIKKIVMLLEKPYSFVVFSEVTSTSNAFTCIHGQKLPSGHIFYLSYICDNDVPKEVVRKNFWPEGLVLLKDFVTEEQEKELLTLTCLDDDSSEKSILKHRKVKHYGYEFIYGSNNIDKKKPLDRKIPEACIQHLQKLVSQGFLPRVPEQLTVNHYLPGQGIPPHVDTHSAFEDGIVALSLSSQIVMDFYNSEETVPILLPRRSALIMLGESRYLWKHGITPRKTDIVPTGDGDHLTLVHRSHRTSFTFRLIRIGPCNCDYKEQCDSQVK